MSAMSSAVDLGVNVIDPSVTLDRNFHKFFQKLAIRFVPYQKKIKKLREDRLTRAFSGSMPNYLNCSFANWEVDLPSWLEDQRNQMTGPADNNELIVKLLNSGAPGVMLDLEDSMRNDGTNLLMAHDLIKSALYGTLTYTGKDYKQVKIQRGQTVAFIRPRGLHMDQVMPTPTKKAHRTSATLFDLAYHFYDLDIKKLEHPPLVYIPKSEGAQEAHWWREVFTYIEKIKGWPHGTIRCMALVESLPMAYEMAEFMYYLRPYIFGLNFGRWDYIASLAHYTLDEPDWVLPDRNKIPHNAEFLQNVRQLMVSTCHAHGALAIGGMTAIYPSRTDEDLNRKALATLAVDKMNESLLGMDGAWTGHPDQNQIAVMSFPKPNQIGFINRDVLSKKPDLMVKPQGEITDEGSRAAIRAALRYRVGVAQGKGAVLIDGYMEDLATDRINRIMLAQRIKHNKLSVQRFEELFNEEIQKIDAINLDLRAIGEATQNLIYDGKFNPE
jgi:malate synthase